MKVLILDLSAKAGVSLGGAARVAGSLFNDLGKHGIETYYLGYGTPYIRPNEHTFILSGGKIKLQGMARKMVHRLGLNGVAESRPGRIAYYSMYSITGVHLEGAEKWIESISPDIILASSIQDYIVLKRIKEHLGKAKIVYIEHANASGAYKSALDYNVLSLTFGTGFYKGLSASQERFFKFFDGIIALNKEQKERIEKLNPNVAVIHSSVLMESLKIDRTKLKNFKRRLELPNNAKTVLYLGRLSETQKNVSTLILAFKGIKGSEFRLIIVGEGKSMPLYAQMSKSDERILMLGRVPEEDLGYCYSVAGLYVLPSIWESFNATMIEAAYFGSGLLLSKLAINKDIMERFGKRLYTFDPYNADELRKKIISYFSKSKLRRRLNLLSRDMAKEYSREKQIKAYADCLKKLYNTSKF